jgi:hypothetical protein
MDGAFFVSTRPLVTPKKSHRAGGFADEFAPYVATATRAGQQLNNYFRRRLK